MRIRPLGLLLPAVLAALSGACGLVGNRTTLETHLEPGTHEEHVLPTTRCGDYFLAEAAVDGQGPFRLLLDTGYPRTQLSRTAADSLDVRRWVRSIDVGGFRATGRIRVGVQDLEMIGRALGTPIDGILGYDVFRDVLLTYDFPAGEVRVTLDSIPIDAPGSMSMDTGERPFLVGRIRDQTLRLLLDTGFSGGIAIPDLDVLPLSGPPSLVGTSVRVDGVAERRGARLGEDLALGALVIVAPVVVETESPRNLLGQDILRDYVVTLDRSRGRATLVAPDGSAPDSIVQPPMYGTGLGAIPRDDHLEIVGVAEGSAADDAGIRVGDRVVEIDGIPVAERGCRPHGEPAAPTERVYTIERAGERTEVPIVTRILVM